MSVSVPCFMAPCKGISDGVPKRAIVPPVLVKTPHGPMFCFCRVFWTADAKRPAVPVTRVMFTAVPIASWGRYGTASSVDDIVAASGARTQTRDVEVVRVVSCGQSVWVIPQVLAAIGGSLLTECSISGCPRTSTISIFDGFLRVCQITTADGLP